MDKSNLQSKEVICVLPIALQTSKDGKDFMFLVMDVASEFIFQAGVEEGDNIENVATQLLILMENTEFNVHKDRPFTLVMTKYEEYRGLIENIIAPYNGKFLVDEAYVVSKTAQAAKHMQSRIETRREN